MHISRDELKKYFELKASKYAENADFIDEIDAHLSECDDCFREFKAVQALWFGFNSSPDAAHKFVSNKNTFLKIKIAVDNMIRVISAQIDGIANLRYTPNSAVAVRGENKSPTNKTDLLYNDLIITDDCDKNIRIYCRQGSNGGFILNITSDKKTEFNLTKDGDLILPKYEKFDDVLGEFITSFELENGDFDLTSR